MTIHQPTAKRPATPLATVSTIGPKPARYPTILADPPWDIEQRGRLGAEQHYPLMSLDRIAAMPVSDLATDDAHLWLWVTNATLRHGYDIAESWGFTVRSPLTWVKFRLGLGNYLRNSTEHLLLCTRGKAPVRYRSQPTWMNAPVTDHSHKPEEQYALIERVSPGPYLELFARRRQPGWDAWGNEVTADIHVPGYPVPSDRRRQNRATTSPSGLTRRPDTPAQLAAEAVIGQVGRKEVRNA